MTVVCDGRSAALNVRVFESAAPLWLKLLNDGGFLFLLRLLVTKIIQVEQIASFSDA